MEKTWWQMTFENCGFSKDLFTEKEVYDFMKQLKAGNFSTRKMFISKLSVNKENGDVDFTVELDAPCYNMMDKFIGGRFVGRAPFYAYPESCENYVPLDFVITELVSDHDISVLIKSNKSIDYLRCLKERPEHFRKSLEKAIQTVLEIFGRALLFSRFLEPWPQVPVIWKNE